MVLQEPAKEYQFDNISVITYRGHVVAIKVHDIEKAYYIYPKYMQDEYQTYIQYGRIK